MKFFFQSIRIICIALIVFSNRIKNILGLKINPPAAAAPTPHEDCFAYCYNLSRIPICAQEPGKNGDKMTFANDCLLRQYNCKYNKNFKKLHWGACNDRLIPDEPEIFEK